MTDRGKSGGRLRRIVEERAGWRCEYCHAPAPVSGYRFHLDHIVPRSKGGLAGPTNRALSCAPCNLAKQDAESAVDPETKSEVDLFNPRTENWDEHFGWDEEELLIVGRTATGRATVEALDLNHPIRRGARELWFATDWLP
jgi:hypothetical protein